MKALIPVDVQNDFLPGGSLAVPEGDQVVPIINGLMPAFDLVVATQDWHPADHESFAGRHPGRSPGEVIDLHGLPQVLWPDHCVQGTPGASFASALDVSFFNRLIRKGLDREIDSYSGFFDNDRRHATGLEQYLRDRSVEHVVVCGLATDYCVKFTALDALHLGFEVTLVRDACRGVNLSAHDVDDALEEIAAAGGVILGSRDLR
ncbi:MAG: bifunctional nicotinamidase/pyrazinamidase [Spirochaetaceae bacterium]|nr:MAG: bifunctional nicotinamidase/pyrazinamidase [Spirochaetaceae bacterium]